MVSPDCEFSIDSTAVRFRFSVRRYPVYNLTVDTGDGGRMAGCSNCGTQNAPEARFCTGCGSPLATPAPPPPPPAVPESSSCPKCGMILPAGVKFCAKCGGTVVMKVPVIPPVQAPNE